MSLAGEKKSRDRVAILCTSHAVMADGVTTRRDVTGDRRLSGPSEPVTDRQWVLCHANLRQSAAHSFAVNWRCRETA